MQIGQDVGLIGPASLLFHHAHAQGFAANEAVAQRLEAGCRCADLGSGGGLPGLVLAEDFPDTAWTLLDARLRSVDHLRDAVSAMMFDDRVAIGHGRGEELARDVELREQFDVVTARGFSGPSITAEIGSGFLAVGGLLVVSEPPDGGADRWDEQGLAKVQLRMGQEWETTDGHYRSFDKIAALDHEYPRRNGVPKKRPLW